MNHNGKQALQSHGLTTALLFDVIPGKMIGAIA